MSEATSITNYSTPGEAVLQALMHCVAPEDEGYEAFLATFCGEAGVEEAVRRYDLIMTIARSATVPTLVFEES